MYTHWNTYSINYYKDECWIVYGNGCAECNSCIWMVIWPEGTF
jgi:hypothetical protein